jgi:2-succinyl-5-enolpyruvyl-6-hydroxy-3-cyclohexene-1-carboxylate synthase
MERDGTKEPYNIGRPFLIIGNDWDSCIPDCIFALFMKQSDIPAARAVVNHCKAYGIENIVISPGSRNAPLTLSFTSDPYFKCYSIVDERSAAFFALGIAQQIRRPVVVLCTSGTALLNYYPAIAEAYYSDIPLVVISADRPEYKIDIGDGQTIRQSGVFEKHIGYSANLRLDPGHSTSELIFWGHLDAGFDPDTVQNLQQETEVYNNGELSRALQLAAERNEPVHVNVPFEEPLYGMLETEAIETKTQIVETADSRDLYNLPELTDSWNSSSKKLIILGVLSPNTISREVTDSWVSDPSVAVLTETTSNLAHPEFINSIDSIIAPAELANRKTEIFEQLRPELLLTLGGPIVSKKIKAFLRQWKPLQHWHVHETKSLNTFNVLSKHIRQNPATFLENLSSKAIVRKSNYKSTWKQADQNQKKLRKEYLQRIPFSDLKAFDLIIRSIPKNYQLQLANSSTIRYSQLFDLDSSLSVYCNRGTSGIDGSTSTAVGASLYNNSPTLLISGDLSFLYDVNGLWNDYVGNNFRIIVINNGGGGIFRILPGKKEDDNFMKFFETAHHTSLESVCQNFGIEFMVASGHKTLKQRLPEFFQTADRPKLLEVQTPRTVNDNVLLDYFEFLSSAIYSDQPKTLKNGV